jgi:hypothetical protein
MDFRAMYVQALWTWLLSLIKIRLEKRGSITTKMGLERTHAKKTKNQTEDKNIKVLISTALKKGVYN